jgi:hypothetical protein
MITMVLEDGRLLRKEIAALVTISEHMGSSGRSEMRLGGVRGRRKPPRCHS